MSTTALTLDVERALVRVLRAERRRSMVLAIAVPVLAVLAALAVGAIVIAVDGNSPLTVYGEVLRGIFRSKQGRADTAIQATPLILLGLGLMVAYRARVFTIGAEGMYLVGAVAAVGWATAPAFAGLPGPVLVVVALLVAAAAGAVWGAIPGVLRAKFGTSVVITSLLLNYIAGAFLQWAVRVGIRDPKSFVPKSRDIGNAAVPLLGSSRTHLGFALAVLLVPIVGVGMARLRAGFRVDVMGDNDEALGANELAPARLAIVVLLVCGAIAGAAGFLQVSGVTSRINPDFGSGYGFTGIVVALLGRLRPAGVLVAALGLSALTIGFDSAERAYRVPSSTVDLILAMIVIFFVAGDALAQRFGKGTR